MAGEADLRSLVSKMKLTLGPVKHTRPTKSDKRHLSPAIRKPSRSFEPHRESVCTHPPVRVFAHETPAPTSWLPSLLRKG